MDDATAPEQLELFPDLVLAPPRPKEVWEEVHHELEGLVKLRDLSAGDSWTRGDRWRGIFKGSFEHEHYRGKLATFHLLVSADGSRVVFPPCSELKKKLRLVQVGALIEVEYAGKGSGQFDPHCFHVRVLRQPAS
jgi:hypothetical protein